MPRGRRDRGGPDERAVLFCRANDDFSSYEIYETRRDADGRWRAPSKPAFAAAWSNADPHIAPDGRTVFFIFQPAASVNTAGGEVEPWIAPDERYLIFSGKGG